jgi:hypothetical protein
MAALGGNSPEAVAWQLLLTIARAEGVDLDRERGGSRDTHQRGILLERHPFALTQLLFNCGRSEPNPGRKVRRTCRPLCG